MTNKKLSILLVDDEKDITSALYRLLRTDYQVTCSNDTDEAQVLVAQNDYALIISDMRMPKMDGASFLAIARQFRPATVRVLLTGHSDLDSTIRAINEGQIFSYISKPWDNQQLKLTIRSACEQFQLGEKLANLNQQLQTQNTALLQVNEALAEQKQTLEQQVSKRTEALQLSNKRLVSAAKKQRSLFQNLLDMVNTIINDRVAIEAGHNKRIAFQARLMAEALKLDKPECTRIYLAALLADLGKVSISDDLMTKSEHELDAKQQAEFQQHVLKGAELLTNLPSLCTVSEIIKHQLEHYSGGGFPQKLKGEQIPIGSRILLILKDYDRLLLGLKYHKKYPPLQAQNYLKSESGHLYDGDLVELFLRLLAQNPSQNENEFDFSTTSANLTIGTVLSQDVHYENGNLFVTKDTVLTETLLDKIRQYENTHEENFTFYVY